MSSSALLSAPAVHQASGAKGSRSVKPFGKQWLSSMRQLALPGGAISIVFVMLIPLPSLVLDLLLGLSIAAAVLVFLSAVQVRKAVDLSVFPTVLLLLTLFRLSLNIASSRRIYCTGAKARRQPAV
jgi:flagellar biosynthesis protein FlhA